MNRASIVQFASVGNIRATTSPSLGMEIVGAVAAVPPLLMMVKRTGVALNQVCTKTRTGKVAQGVRAQLDLLADILASVERRPETTDRPGSGQEARLGSVIGELATEITKLLDLLDKAAEGFKGRSNVFKRAQVMPGYEKDLEEHGQRLRQMVSMLLIHVSEWTIRSSLRSQIRKVLATSPSTDFIPKKLDGTLEWIWVHEEFTRWARPMGSSPSTQTPTSLAQDPDSRVLMIHGVEGCGKSVLAASVVDGLRTAGNTALFFSFWASHDRERRVDAMLRALLWQLLEALPEDTQSKFIPRLLEIRAQPDSAGFLVDQVSDMAQALASDMFCILDGIDESADDWNDPSDVGPLAYLDKLTQAVPNMRLLLVGRQSSLRLALGRWPCRIELTRDLVLADLNRLISAELDNCPNVTDDKTRSIVRRELDAKSTVTFLWIKLVFQVFRSSFGLRVVSHTLGSMPEELDREYSRLFSMLMTRMHGRPDNPSLGMARAKGLLEIIVGASRPLSVMELCLAYAFSSMSEEPNAGYLDCLVTEEDIIDACGDFATMKDGLIYLGHTSIREFLLRPPDRWAAQDDNIAYFRLDSKRCHRVLGTACLKYLQHVDWEKDGFGSSDEEFCLWADSLSRQYPLVHYASSFVASHILDSGLSPEEVSANARAFLMSGKSVAWIDFAAFAADRDSPIAPPPLHFWEDVIQFWIACFPPGTSEHLVDLTTLSWDGVSPAHVDDGGLPIPAVPSSTAAAAAVEMAHLEVHNRTTTPVRRNTDSLVQNHERAFENIRLNRRAHTMGETELRLAAVRGLSRKVDFLIDHFDIPIQVVERFLENVSF